MFSGRYWFHIQDSMDLRDFLCPSFQKMSQHSGFPKNEIYEKQDYYFSLCLLIRLRSPGVCNDKNNWFWVGLDTSQIPEIIEMRVYGLSHKQIEKLLHQIDAE